MDQKLYDSYVKILKNELVPALGCTEPIAIAYAAAKAREVLGEMPESIELCCSGNIIKNVKGVKVPNSNGLKGIDVAATLGVVGGCAERELEVLEDVTEADIEKTKELVQQGFCTCTLKEGVENLYIVAKVIAGEHSAEVTIVNRHTLISRIVKDGEILYQIAAHEDSPEYVDKSVLNVKDILEFADTVKIEDVKEILDRQITMNSAISDEGLRHAYGAQVGRTLLNEYGDDVKIRARAHAAAGSDARMSGCSLPVVINSGSGKPGHDRFPSCHRVCKRMERFPGKTVPRTRCQQPDRGSSEKIYWKSFRLLRRRQRRLWSRRRHYLSFRRIL